jgi:hypothetical protein
MKRQALVDSAKTAQNSKQQVSNSLSLARAGGAENWPQGDLVIVDVKTGLHQLLLPGAKTASHDVPRTGRVSLAAAEQVQRLTWPEYKHDGSTYPIPSHVDPRDPTLRRIAVEASYEALKAARFLISVQNSVRLTRFRYLMTAGKGVAFLLVWPKKRAIEGGGTEGLGCYRAGRWRTPGFARSRHARWHEKHMMA